MDPAEVRSPSNKQPYSFLTDIQQHSLSVAAPWIVSDPEIRAVHLIALDLDETY